MPIGRCTPSSSRWAPSLPSACSSSSASSASSAPFPRGEDGDRTWLNHPISLTLIAFAFTSVPRPAPAQDGATDTWAASRHGLGTAHRRHRHVGHRCTVAPATSRTRPHVEEMSLGQAIWIGLCQSLSAIFPGTSRSMSTIAAGQMVGLDRPSALEFRPPDAIPRPRSW